MTWPILITFACLAQGVANTMFGKVSAAAGTPYAIALYLTCTGLTMAGIVAMAGHPLKWEAVGNTRVLPFFAGGVITMALANYFLTRAMETAPIGLGFAIFNATITIVGLAITVFAFGEKLTTLQMAGVALAIVATFMMMAKG